MVSKLAINGFGRMGRLAMRLLFERDDLEVVAINEPNSNAEVLATLMQFDSVHGRWQHECGFEGEALVIADQRIPLSSATRPKDIPWSDLGIDLVLECSGKFRQVAELEPYFAKGAKRVVVSAPIAEGAPNIVMGVNHEQFDLAQERIVTAASCTTNCLSPVVKALHDAIGIERGLVTTIHAPTNTQEVLDAPQKDARRARASQLSLIPTSTNSAKAVTMILPELKGKLDSIAVRAPVMNASLVDLVVQVARDTRVDEINGVFKAAAEGPMKGIIGFETRPLVSVDFVTDPRSAIIDGLSTRVTDNKLVKILAWYDNEWGYVNRMVELTGLIAKALQK